MNKVLIIALAALLSFNGNVFAQKTGHISLNDLLLLLPERKKAENDIQEFAKQLEGQLKTMRAEYESKISDYQAKESMMTDPVKLDRQREIANLEDRIQNFQVSAQESLQKKQNDLLEPMIEKCKKSIEEVAKENGYKNVIDSSQGVLLYADPADDLMPLVKKKMNLTAAPADGTKAPEKK
jgi:outer membrane protein